MSNDVLQVAVGVVTNARGEVLIAYRPESVHQGDRWEFPGGKLELGETAEGALIRELKEELGLTVKDARPLIVINHQYSDLRVKLWVWNVDAFIGPVCSNEGQVIRWVPVEALKHYAFPAANSAIVNAVQLPSQYAIVGDDSLISLQRTLPRLVENNVKLIQLRTKLVDATDLQELLEYATFICNKNQVILMVNSALRVGDFPIANLHLTSKDLMVLDQRPEVEGWVGASCHNRAELQQAEAIGVDFVVLAPVKSTATHPKAKPLGWLYFQELVAQVNIPVYALGGMMDSDLTSVYECGGQGVAGIRTFLA
ncbi:MAG: Nudix family hydrolase [Methylococcales bacterium]|nr:Nudix family hydrolase [Methylococcales bacterium]